jgi:phenylacetate-CoA ligase
MEGEPIAGDESGFSRTIDPTPFTYVHQKTPEHPIPEHRTPEYPNTSIPEKYAIIPVPSLVSPEAAMLNVQTSEAAIAAFADFIRTPLMSRLEGRTADQAQASALELFQSVAHSVPAYGAFLEHHGVSPDAIREFADFERLPTITKENYLLRYPLPQLCRNGRLESNDMIAVSSGSTGTPCFWPRFLCDEIEVVTRFEQVFHGSFRADERRTLAVVCFTLGTWVGGMYTTACCRLLAAKGYPITVVTPGNNREEIYKAVAELSPLYDQTVLLGYPPFLKGIVDEGRARGIDWATHGIRCVMAGEVFSEEWRGLVGERAGSHDPLHDSASLYGTADAGVLGNETPLSICIRRWLSANPRASRELFRESRLPTLVQYDPMSRFFEALEGGLIFSGDNGIPLIRYNILDTGGIVAFDALLEFLRDWGFDPLAAFASDARGVYRLPFVYVFGRSNFTVSYYGANIFPENVTVGLEQTGINEWVTGKFVLQAIEGEDRNLVLSIAVELAPWESESEARAAAVAASIRDQLLRLNSEFANYVPPAAQTPRVTLRPTGDPEYFPVGVKHRYTRPLTP